MIHFKTPKEIEIMYEGGSRLSSVLKELVSMASPGISTLEIDKAAEKLLFQTGGEPSFKRVPGYRYSICSTVNDEVVHGLPTGYKLKDGDILGIDIGLFYKGFHTDTSVTVPIGNIDPEAKRFLLAGRESLNKSIKEAKPGNRIWHISKAMEDVIKSYGYSPVRSLTGHGVGKELHEEPLIPCFAMGSIEQSPEIKSGMVLAIEAIYNQKGHQVRYKNDDNWTISTTDGSLSGVFEATIAVEENGPRILTPLLQVE